MSPASLGRIRIENHRDFSGGLNRITDQFLLAPNESPDLDSVDLVQRGGFKLRKGVQPWGGAGTASFAFGNATMQVNNLFQAEGLATITGGRCLIACSTDGATHAINYTTGSGTAWTLLSSSASGTPWPTVQAYMSSAQGACSSDRITKVYMANFTSKTRSWDGTTLTALTENTYNEDLSTPARGRFPKAKFIIHFQGRMWAAYTSETAGTFSSRIRFSHPGEYEDWRVNDYIEIDFGGDGDAITGLAVKGDRLFIFKSHSVFEITGTSADNFQVFPYSRHVGACDVDAICVADVGIFFFDSRAGLHLINNPNAEPVYMFEKLKPSLLDGTFANTNFTNGRSVNMAWNGRKLFLGLPLTGKATSTEMFVLDMTLQGGKEAWTRYESFQCDALTTWRVGTEVPVVIMAALDPFATDFRRIVYLEASDTKDTYVSGSDHPIPSYYTTAWYDIGSPTVQKRFKRPTYLVRNQEVSTFHVDIYQDWDQSAIAKSHDVTTSTPGATGVWGSGMDVAYWSGTGSNRESPLKGTNLGSAYSVQLKLTAPTTAVQWAVDEISLRYIPKRVR